MIEANTRRPGLRTIPGLLTAVLCFALAPLALAQTPAEPYLVVGGFTTILAEPDIDADVLGRPTKLELTITGISADGAFYRIGFRGQAGWIHQSAVLKIEGDLDDVPVVLPVTDPPTISPLQPGMPNSLQDYDKDWSSAVTELQETGMIPRGGSLIFEEDYAFLSGHGDYLVSLGRDKPETDIIMGGELTYRVGTKNDYENCVLMSRIVPQSGSDRIHSLEIGLDNEQAIIFFDRFGPGDIHVNYDYINAGVNLDMPHHFLILALDNRLTVYLDGQMVINDFEIDERSGFYGIGLSGRGADARCEGRNIWVYEIPYTQPGVCEIHVDRPVNLRRGPGTDYDQAGRLASGTTQRARAATVGGDGFIWWQLENGSWVRNDVVNAFGSCQNLPGPASGPTI